MQSANYILAPDIHMVKNPMIFFDTRMATHWEFDIASLMAAYDCPLDAS